MARGRKKYAAGMASAISDLTGCGREMVETAIEIMRNPLEDGNVRMKAIDYLTDRMAGKAPLVIEAEMTATMIGGRSPDELSDAQLAKILAMLESELGPDEPAQLPSGELVARVIDIEEAEVVDAGAIAAPSGPGMVSTAEEAARGTPSELGSNPSGSTVLASILATKEEGEA